MVPIVEESFTGGILVMVGALHYGIEEEQA
jgi:hypothetical protein